VRKEIGVDYLEAAESRIRQLQAHNANLEKQVRRLKEKIEEAEDEAALNSRPERTHATGGRPDRRR
jgi:cell division septum initiation protein DivIVA